MTLVLPEEGQFAAVRDSLTSDWLVEVTNSARNRYVALELPRFQFTWGSASLRRALDGLGMVDAFYGEVADFSGIAENGNLVITDVIQRAYVGVDEDGAEAAAVTAVTLAPSGGEVNEPPPPIPVILDRPFFFLIRDADGHFLFVGQVTEP